MNSDCLITGGSCTTAAQSPWHAAWYAYWSPRHAVHAPHARSPTLTHVSPGTTQWPDASDDARRARHAAWCAWGTAHVHSFPPSLPVAYDAPGESGGAVTELVSPADE